MMLSLFAIDPHSRWGPILQHFLSLLDKVLDYNFPQHQPNARNMFTISTTHPCPIGILRTADCIWYGARIRGTKTYIFNSLSAKSVLAGEKLVATYSFSM